MEVLYNKKSPICPICTSWMLNHPSLQGYLKCNSCGYTIKDTKTIITPVGVKNGTK